MGGERCGCGNDQLFRTGRRGRTGNDSHHRRMAPDRNPVITGAATFTSSTGGGVTLPILSIYKVGNGAATTASTITTSPAPTPPPLSCGTGTNCTGYFPLGTTVTITVSTSSVRLWRMVIELHSCFGKSPFMHRDSQRQSGGRCDLLLTGGWPTRKVPPLP